MSVAILAIGTEITDGQITNRNSAWLSARMTEFGLKTHEHRSVPDDHQAIQKALAQMVPHCRFLFVTGGLGPTTDDFTRDGISKFFGLELVFNESAWQELNDNLNGRNVPVSSSHRQQCFFPVGAELLTNPVGTASGFWFEAKGCFICALPGPPAEIEGIWKKGLMSLIKRHQKTQTTELRIWRCMGKGESELADLTEMILGNQGFVLGYRAHVPYVEIKAWVPVGHSDLSALKKLEEALEPWLVNRDQEDLAVDFLQGLPGRESFHIYDMATKGLLAERLSLAAREIQDAKFNLTIETVLGADTLPPSEPKSFTHGLIIFPDPQKNSWLVVLRGQHPKTQELKPPYRNLVMTERARKYITEASLRFVIKNL